MEILYLVLAFAVNLFLAFVAKYVAIEKGRNGNRFFVLSLLVSFLVAILVLIALPALPAKPKAKAAPYISTGSPAKVVAAPRGADAESKLNSLTRMEYQEWKEAGEPDIARWSGSNFDAWIAQDSSAETST